MFAFGSLLLGILSFHKKK
nr:hypothetical protein [Brevibacillus dissolubilis]